MTWMLERALAITVALVAWVILAAAGVALTVLGGIRSRRAAAREHDAGNAAAAARRASDDAAAAAAHAERCRQACLGIVNRVDTARHGLTRRHDIDALIDATQPPVIPGRDPVLTTEDLVQIYRMLAEQRPGGQR